MSAEPIERILKLWETKQITQVQAMGKILVWCSMLNEKQLELTDQLSEMERRLAKLEAKPNGETPTNAEGDF